MSINDLLILKIRKINQLAKVYTSVGNLGVPSRLNSEFLAILSSFLQNTDIDVPLGKGSHE